MDDKKKIRALGFGPELEEFPVRTGQLLLRDDMPASLPWMDMVTAVKATMDGICVYTAGYDGTRFSGMSPSGGGSSLWLGAGGNVFPDKAAMDAAHDWFYRNGTGLPQSGFRLDPDGPAPEPPPAPYFTVLSAFALGAWFFGEALMAPERPGNEPYDGLEDIADAAGGRFVWAEHLATGREYLCRLVRSSPLSRICDVAVACSFYYPYEFPLHGYRMKPPGMPVKGTWIARARPKQRPPEIMTGSL